MSKIPKNNNYQKLKIDDFVDNNKNNYQKLKIEDLIDNTNKNNSCRILFEVPKNQKEFGHKKRIKP